MANESGIYAEAMEIIGENMQRYESLDADLKARLEPLVDRNSISFIPMDKIVDLFMSHVYYPELTELNFISFGELSNDCMKKVLSQEFNLIFIPDPDTNSSLLIVKGVSTDGVKIGAYYSKPRKDVFDDFFSDEKKPKEEKEEPLPEKSDLVGLFRRTHSLRIRLPAGFFV